MDLKNRCIEYFQKFSSKNIDYLATLFADDMSLRDWDIDVAGKAAVLEANRNIFNKVDTLSVAPTAIYLEGKTAIAEIDIHINRTETLKVVDVIEFNDDHQIRAIRAYKA